MADDDDRWTIRGVPKVVQEQAKAAAGRLKVSIGAYVTSAIDSAISGEREPITVTMEGRTYGDVLSEAVSEMARRERAMELDDIERTIAAAVALAGAADVPVAFRRRANRVLRERLPGPPGRPPAAPAARRLPAPESETPAV